MANIFNNITKAFRPSNVLHTSPSEVHAPYNCMVIGEDSDNTIYVQFPCGCSITQIPASSIAYRRTCACGRHTIETRMDVKLVSRVGNEGWLE